MTNNVRYYTTSKQEINRLKQCNNDVVFTDVMVW